MNEPSVVTQGNINVFVPGFDPKFRMPGGQLCVAEQHSSMFLVSEDRVIYELDLRLNFSEGVLATSMGTDFPRQPYCKTDYQVTSNGSRIVGLYMRCPQWSGTTTNQCEEEQLVSQGISKTRVELNIVDLSETPDHIQTIELNYSDPESSALHTHDVTLSPDFSVLQAGVHIFDLLAPGHLQLSFPDSLLSSLRREKGACIHFSACSGYLIIIEGKSLDANDEIAVFGLFRIHRAAGKIERLAMVGLDDLAAYGFEAAFHPMLPLLLLTYVTYGRSEFEDVTKATKVVEVDLEASKSVQIDIPKHRIGISQE